MKQNNLTKMFTILMILVGTSLMAATVPVNAVITSNITWTNNNIYVLYGEIIVKNNATLTIQPGTLIKGDKNTGGKLVIAAGAKINAQGTAAQPIVFTSNQPAGQRQRGDWSGIAILGKAPVNFKNANDVQIQGLLECGTAPDYNYGGTDPNDSSGVLSYVRIEYAGYICGTNTELNSLTLGGVGAGTKLDHVQVSYGQDDGIEWFGGTVNASHLISFASRDDDFDTDNGYSGKVQFGLIVRIDSIADQGDISNAFESDNDANSTYNTPNTSAVFSNITVVGPAQTTTSTIDAKYGWAARLRRNTSLSIFNSIILGYKRGVRIEGSVTQNKALTDSLEFKYNIIEGSKEQAYESSFDSAYLANPATHNTVYGGNANATLLLVNPFNRTAPDFTLQATSPALAGADFSAAKLTGFTSVAYKGAFGGSTTDWTKDWANFDPQSTPYLTPLAVENIAVVKDIVVVPNPTSGNAKLVFNLEKSAYLNIHIFDLQGRLVNEVANRAFSAGSHALALSFENLQSGIYIAKVANDSGTSTAKIVVSK